MFNILAICFICFFAAFGVVQFLDTFFGGTKTAKNKIISVIPLHNNEEDVEGIVRSAFLNHERIIAVDYGSYDNTLAILQSLKEEYAGLLVYTQEEFINYLKDYNYVGQQKL